MRKEKNPQLYLYSTKAVRAVQGQDRDLVYTAKYTITNKTMKVKLKRINNFRFI